jgi:hypothetical protein
VRENGSEAATADGVAAVAVSLIHGCALQALIAPTDFDVKEHFVVVRRLIDEIA